MTPDAGTPDWQLVLRVRTLAADVLDRGLDDDVVFRRAAARRAASRRPRRAASASSRRACSFRSQHVRVAQTALASIVRADDDYFRPAGTVSLPSHGAAGRLDARARRTPIGYSISPERGVALGATAEAVRRALGASGDATTLTGDARAYLPGLAPHQVLALRVVGRLVDRRDRRPPHVSPRRRRGRARARSTSDPRRSACCADFRSTPSPARHVGARQRRLPRAARAARARRRHVAALPPHGARRRCSPTPATRGRARSARATSRRRSARSSPSTSSPATGCRSRRRSARRGDTTARAPRRAARRSTCGSGRAF